MYEAVLVYAYVYEGSEIGYVRDYARKFHARLQVFEFPYVFREPELSGLSAGIEPRLGQFLDDVAHGGKPCIAAHEILRIYSGAHLRVAYEMRDVGSQALGHLFHDTVGLGVHGGVVEGVLGALDAQEARALLEGLGSEPRHVRKLFPALERPVGVPVVYDVLGKGRPYAGHICQQVAGGRVEVDANGVDAALDRGLELLFEQVLVYVVLVLAYAEVLGVYLHEFGKGIH